MKKDWSIKEIQNLVLDNEEWEKKNLYATDSEKCPRGLYLSLTGAKPETPIDPESLRRMEVGKLIEDQQLKKLRSLGILLATQDRIYDETYNVSGRLDALIIDPHSCTEEAKSLIDDKKMIFNKLETLEKNFWKGHDKYRKGEVKREVFIAGAISLLKKKQELYDADDIINKILLEPNPENPLMIIEIKSINEWGFKYRQSDGTPMESHEKQTMFYLWKYREKYPYIIARVLYAQIPYQDLLEFDVELDLKKLDEMKAFWKYINDCIREKTPPVAAPSVIQNNKTGKYNLNYQADWCRYHIQCTGDPNWKTKAFEEVKKLNGQIKPKRKVGTTRKKK